MSLNRQALNELRSHGITLVLTGAENYQKAVLELIEYLVNQRNEFGVYVTLNKPFFSMKKLLEPKIDLRKVIFIDGFTKLAGGKPEKTEGVLYITSIEDLTGMSFALDQAVKSIPSREKFVFFDSLSTLLIYNKTGSVTKFIHFLTGKIRLWDIDGVFISLSEEDDQVISKLSMFCDKILHLDRD
ncbi:MAG: hypothetical protein QXJ68_03635 [Methanocellales archaeon]